VEAEGGAFDAGSWQANRLKQPTEQRAVLGHEALYLAIVLLLLGGQSSIPGGRCYFPLSQRESVMLARMARAATAPTVTRRATSRSRPMAGTNTDALTSASA
jgi:hypothetical protein